MTSKAATSAVQDAIRTRKVSQPTVFAGMARLARNIADQVEHYAAIGKVPAAGEFSGHDYVCAIGKLNASRLCFESVARRSSSARSEIEGELTWRT